ncbi:MAG TPA: DUF1499 domain-containing protein [Longimicrobiaceae bacterium]|nr:DUF1499 domain-containing protein [Longimicrobiaceae bacterium]
MSQSRRSQVPVIAGIIAALTVIAALAAVLSGFATRWGWWDFRTGFSILRWSIYAAIGLGVAALIVLILAVAKKNSRAIGLTGIAILIALVIVAVPWRWRQISEGAPPIHDVTTDTENPPEFAAIYPLRADAPNPAEYGGPEIAAQQKEAFPDIQPLIMPVPPMEAFDRAVETARAMGWEIVEADASEGRIEATDETFWFGFKDDVVIRVQPVDAGARVDVRSVSRVGRGDMGTNARRVDSYLDRLKEM